MKDKRIDECTKEAPGQWFVYLTTGYQMDGQHCFGEDTLRAVKQTMRRVTPCQCSDCKAQMVVS